jgi:uncharacterized protein
VKRASIRSPGALLALDLHVTTNVFDRLKGWMGRKSIDERDALLIRPCNSIHTWFMSMPIDVVFLDRTLRIVRVHEHVGPRQFRSYWRAASTLELKAGRAAALGLVRGTQLAIDHGVQS